MKRQYSAKKTYNLIDPTNRSHSIFVCVPNRIHNSVQLLRNCCATMGVPSRNEERIHQSTSNLCDISHSLIQMPRFGRDNGMHETKVRHGVETPPPRSF